MVTKTKARTNKKATETSGSDGLPKMSFRLSSHWLQNQLDSSVEHSTSPTRNSWLGSVIEIVLNLRPQLSTDILSELRSIALFMSGIEWERVHILYQAITSSELTRQATKIDVLLAIFGEGLKQYEQKYIDKS